MSTDQKGEQTIDKDAKTVEGIKNFASNKSSVLKWCFSCSEQTKNTKALKHLCGISTNVDQYKPCIRNFQILKSNKLLDKIVTVLSEDYTNPFELNINQTKSVNLSSGSHVLDDLAYEILSIPENSLKFRI